MRYFLPMKPLKPPTPDWREPICPAPTPNAYWGFFDGYWQWVVPGVQSAPLSR